MDIEKIFKNIIVAILLTAFIYGVSYAMGVNQAHRDNADVSGGYVQSEN